MKRDGIVGLIVKCLILCGIASGLTHCGGHYRYCVESAHFDAASETKSLTRDSGK